MKKSSNSKQLQQPPVIGQEVHLRKQTAIGVVKAVVEATEAHPEMARVLWPSIMPEPLHLGAFLEWHCVAELEASQ